MDPFSITLGVIPLVALVKTTISATRGYLSSAKHAKSLVAVLIAELEALKTNLESLDEFLQGEASKGVSFKRTCALRSCMSSCDVRLKSLCEKLSQVGETRQSRYLWPLSQKEYEKAVQDLRTFTHWIKFSLSVDGLSLLSRTSDDVLRILELQAEGFRALKTLQDETTQLRVDIRDQSAKLQDDRNKKRRQHILKWISGVEQDQKHHRLRSPRVDGTGGWLLKRPEYVRWRDNNFAPNVLWCYGIQGSGKTVLTTIVIDEIKKSMSAQEAAAFYYFDYKDQDQQAPSDILSSILRQILASMPDIPECVADAYDKLQGSTSPLLLHELQKLIISVTKDIQRTYIIIDALDECSELKHRKPLLSFLDQIKQNQTVRLFVTSRQYPQDIRKAFHAQPQIVIQAHKSDLRRYLYQELDNASIQDIVDDRFATRIVDTLVNNAQGMFLLSVLQIRTIITLPTVGDIEDALTSLSQDLPEAIGETIARIKRLPESRSRLGMQILMWVSHAKREMTASQLSDALSVSRGQKMAKPTYRPSTQIMEACCLGLVIIDRQTMVVRLAHYSIQECLTNLNEPVFVHAEADLAMLCLTHLLLDSFGQGPLEDEVEIKSRIKSHPFLPYASICWGLHAQQSEKDPDVRQLLFVFFDSKNATANADQIMRYSQRYREVYWELGECYSTTPLHLAGHFGLESPLYELLEQKNISINAPTKMGTTALVKAASRGHVSVVKTLLHRGADPYLANWYGNALHCAAEAGHSSVIRELILHGMEVNDNNDGDSRSPIRCTLDNDCADAFKTLVSLNAKIDPGDEIEGKLSLFHIAVLFDCTEIVTLLLDEEWVDVNSRSKNGYTALHCAVTRSNIPIIRRLVKAGAFVNARNHMGLTPLDFALENSDKAMISSLLKHDARSARVTKGKMAP